MTLAILFHLSCAQHVSDINISIFRLQPAKRTPPNTSRNKNSHTQRTENKTTDVVIHQHSRKLLKMDILMSETCWAHDKWNKIASDIKLVFHSPTIAMMHGPINIRYQTSHTSRMGKCAFGGGITNACLWHILYICIYTMYVRVLPVTRRWTVITAAHT